MKESEEIRLSLNSIKQRLNESLVFDETIKPKNDEAIISNDEETLEPEPMNDSFDVSSTINDIRKIAITAMVEINPVEDPDNYKLLKSILDSCDRSFSKNNEKNKEI